MSAVCRQANKLHTADRATVRTYGTRTVESPTKRTGSTSIVIYTALAIPRRRNPFALSSQERNKGGGVIE